MKIILKRVGAYLIDIILVSLVSTLLVSNNYINKDYDKYNDIYDEYKEEYDKYISFYDELEEFYENNKISKKEYNKLIENDNIYTKYLEKSFDDENISKKEYNNILEKINKEYLSKENDYSYKLVKYSIIPTIVSLMCILLYFVVIQFYFDGQTLGKKIMNLKVISNNDKKLNILNFLIRSLIVNEVFINILNVIFIIILSKKNYIVYNQIIYFVTYLLEMLIIFTMSFDKNNRGLHDYISNTKVIESKK